MLNQIVDALLPPVGLAFLTLVLLLLGRRWAARAGLAAIALLVLLSVPLISNLLLNSLAPDPAPPGPPPQAIVILSADGVHIWAEDPATPDLEPGPLTLDRLRAGAALARQTALPMLVTGGEMNQAHTSLAEMMAASLHDDFRLTARWQEGRSRDTWQNASFSAEILRRDHVTRLYLVTHFWHMQRSLIAFRRAGLDPVPAPVRSPYDGPFSWYDLVPRSSAWYNSYIGFHEWVGLIYYRLRG